LARKIFTSQRWSEQHVFGLFVRFAWPLAIMPSAGQVPVNSTHSTMRWHRWVVPPAGPTVVLWFQRQRWCLRRAGTPKPSSRRPISFC